MKLPRLGLALGVLLLLTLAACETRSTTVVNDDDVDRVAVVDRDPDVTVVNPQPAVVERVWWNPTTWSRTTTTRTTTTTTQPATTTTTQQPASGTASGTSGSTGTGGTTSSGTTTSNTTTTTSTT